MVARYHDTGLVTESEADTAHYTQLGYRQPYTLGEWLRMWAKKYTTRIALVDGDNSLTYAELDARADRLAAGLYAQGIRQGDRVMLQLPNSNHFVVLCFALFRIGAWPIMVMPAQRENDITALCQVAEPVAYVVPDQFLGHDYVAMAERIKATQPSLQHLIIDGDAGQWCALQDLECEAIDLPLPHYTDPALLLLSGGTTGTPKLIPRTHADYAYNATASAQICGFNQDTVYLVALPVAHNFPLACPGVFGTLSVGGKAVMAKTPGGDEAFPLIAQHNVNVTALVPPLVQLWFTAREWDTTNLSSLQLLQIGGSRLDPEVAKQVTPILGCQLQQVFGMAEGLLCYTRLDDPEEVVINTQGRPLSPHDEIRIVDSAGQAVAEGEVGELHTRGPYTLRGYYRAVAHNAKTFTPDGFYQSGDLVCRTPEGNIVVKGRIKEQINRAGEKIATAEIEQHLNEHPHIESSVLVPIPDERLGERSCAFIITDGASLDLATVQQYLHAKGLPRYKWPDQLEETSFWPLTTVGKIDKKRLVTMVAETATPAPIPTSDTAYYVEHRLKVTGSAMDIMLDLAQCDLAEDYAIYEQPQEWAIGIGKYVAVTANRTHAYLHHNGEQQTFHDEQISTAIHNALQQVPIDNWRAYGSAKFELSYVFYNIDSIDTNNDTLVDLFIPEYEIRIREGEALLRVVEDGRGRDKLAQLIKLVTAADKQAQNAHTAAPREAITAPIVHHKPSDYKARVQNAISEIHANHYQKIILSRRIPLPPNVDLLGSYHNGRLRNSPARSFFLSQGEAQVTGFSPETVVEVSASGLVSTQPLAGTRSLGETAEEEARLRAELLNDTKEIAEHAVSVKLAQAELALVCESDSIYITDFMGVRRRGSVQHLASRLKGQLAAGKTAWDAFAALFPAVTASGIPKKPALEAIQRHEPVPRNWYSGCVMIIDSDGNMDAALVLRSLYRQGNKCWLQAGAGIIDQSKPERELQETIEKLTCVEQHLVSHPRADEFKPIIVEEAAA